MTTIKDKVKWQGKQVIVRIVGTDVHVALCKDKYTMLNRKISNL